MRLESEFRWNEKLRRCALYDNEHISKIHSPIGDWVELIHKALNAWVKRIPVKPEPYYMLYGNIFNERTAVMVKHFKEFYVLLNYQNEIDRIVGKKTVYWLDKELPRKPFDP